MFSRINTLIMLAPVGWGILGLAPLSIFLGYRIVQRINGSDSKADECRNAKSINRSGSQTGCLVYGCAILAVFFINLFTLLISIALFTWTYKKIDSTLNGERYLATVVDVNRTIDIEGESEYISTLQLTTSDGITRTFISSYSSSTPDSIGKVEEVLFSPKSGKFLKVSAESLIWMGVSFMSMFLMLTILLFAFAGELFYALEFDMDRFWSIVNSFFMLFFVPLMMVLFDALLIYGLLYGNETPLWTTALLVFFIVVLSLAIVGYVKNMLKKGAPKCTRRSPDDRWISDDDDRTRDGYTTNW